MLPASERYIVVRASLNTRLSSHLIVFDMSFFSVVAGGKHERAETCVTAPVLQDGNASVFPLTYMKLLRVFCFFYLHIEQAARMLLLLLLPLF